MVDIKTFTSRIDWERTASRLKYCQSTEKIPGEISELKDNLKGKKQIWSNFSRFPPKVSGLPFFFVHTFDKIQLLLPAFGIDKLTDHRLASMRD